MEGVLNSLIANIYEWGLEKLTQFCGACIKLEQNTFYKEHNQQAVNTQIFHSYKKKVKQ